MRRQLSLLFCAFLLALSAGLAGAQELTVAAASDLQSVLPALAQRFEQETGSHVRLTFGSSGNFFTQIQNGAPFDVYFSADAEYPTRLDQAGLAEPGSMYRYAIGRIVLWSRKESGVDVTKGLAVLATPGVRKIAIANPEHAPYGRAAVAALRSQRLYDQVEGKFVLGENISQAAQFAQSGNAEAGIIALSVALSPALQQAGRYYEIPAAFHPPIEQAAVIVRASPRKDLAKRFIAFVQRTESARLLQQFGFGKP